MLRRINSMPLRKKIFLLAVGSELLILGVAAVLGLYMLASNRAQLSQSVANSLLYASKQVEQSLDSVKALTGYMIGDSTIQEQLSIVYNQPQSVASNLAYHKLYDSIIAFYQRYREPKTSYISLVTDSFSVSTSLTANNTPDDVIQELCARAEAAGGSPCVVTDWSDAYGLFVSRAVRQVSPFNLKTTGIVIIRLDMEQLMAEATTFAVTYENTYFILSDHGNVFYKSPGLGDDAEAALDRLDANFGVISLNGSHYFAQRGGVGDSGWNSVCLIPYEKEWSNQRNSYLLFIAILIAAMFLTALLSNVIARSISKRFTALVSKMRTFRGQKMEQNAVDTEADSNDEVGLLHRQFDSMADEITKLIQDKYVTELLAKGAQLKALEAQVNPHFLYNVLESINWRAHEAGVSDISEIVDALGCFLRVSLDRSKKLITLGEELSLVDYYITIQRYRFEDHIDYICEVPQTLMGVMLPKLVIQPLVDNAVKYAVETSLDECCSIYVTACISGHALVIDVKNSGSTMSDGLLESLRDGAVQPHGFGIGLTNIDERLRLTFGKEYGLRLLNADGLAICRLKVPLNCSIPAEFSKQGGK